MGENNAIMTESPLPDYALPQGAVERLKPLGYGNLSTTKNTILRCLNCPQRRTFAYGLEIMNCSGIPGGAIYPVLKGLEKRGFLESKEEQINPTQVGRPRRVFYTISRQGQQELGETPPLSSCQRRSMA